MALIKSHRDAVAAERVHRVDEDRIAHHADLEALQIVDRPDRLLGVVDVARAGIHPGEADQARRRMVAELLHQLVADLAVDDLLHVSRIAEHERQVEDVELGNERSHRTDADAGHGEGADLRLLDHLLLAAELHRRIHLDAETAARRRFELLAHALDRLDRRIAERMHVGRLQHHLRLRKSRGRRGRSQGEHGDRQEWFHQFHVSPPLFPPFAGVDVSGSWRDRAASVRTRRGGRLRGAQGVGNDASVRACAAEAGRRRA
jgi:hypothetical protein